jgi:hypothetical protein
LKQSVSPATVNREVALMKHVFNMVEHWQLFFGRNPVRGVKSLQEDNLQFRFLSEGEEVDLENAAIKVLVRKNRACWKSR